MDEMIHIFLSLGFIFSIIGWLLFAKHTLKVPFAFIPAFVLSSITVLVYYGGILNILYPTACTIYIG